MLIMRFTGPRNIHNLLLFSLLSFEPTDYLQNLLAMKTRQIYSPWKPAKLMCRKGSPKWPAKIICRGNLPNSSATLTRGFYSPEKGAIAARGIDLPENPPSPLRIPRQDPARHPPPLWLRVTEEGGGGGELTWLAQTSRTGTFPFVYISFTYSIWYNIYAFYTERINEWKYNYIAFRRRKWLLGRGEGPAPSRPSERNVLHNLYLIGGQQARHTDRDRDA